MRVSHLIFFFYISSIIIIRPIFCFLVLFIHDMLFHTVWASSGSGDSGAVTDKPPTSP